jgi:hypothetical protein
MCEMCRGYLGVFDQMVCDLSLVGLFEFMIFVCLNVED